MTTSTNVCAIVVTHNRRQLLKKCIEALRTQTCKPDSIIVVDNNSTDGTREWLRQEQQDILCIHQENQGCAGGMATGIQHGVSLGADWFWLMDDDTLPQASALEKLKEHPSFTSGTAGFLGSVVKWHDGNVHVMNLLNPDCVSKWLGTVLIEKSIPVVSASFVSILVSRKAVERVGLPLRGLFIWGDDIEFTRRISSCFPCFVVLESEVVHSTSSNAGARAQLSSLEITSAKFWCWNRNMVVLDFLTGGRPVKVFMRLVVRTCRLLESAPSVKSIPIILGAVFDGLSFAMANKQFQLPLQTKPVEAEPVRWPRCRK